MGSPITPNRFFAYFWVAVFGMHVSRTGGWRLNSNATFSLLFDAVLSTSTARSNSSCAMNLCVVQVAALRKLAEKDCKQAEEACHKADEEIRATRMMFSLLRLIFQKSNCLFTVLIACAT